MNKQRREKLRQALSTIGLFVSKLQESRGVIEEIRDEEQNGYDNLPEGLQEADMGSKMQDAIDSLDEAISELDSAIESAESALSEIDNARQ